jgi:serine/threonine protein kinase
MPQFDELAKTRQYSPEPSPPASGLRDRVALIESGQGSQTAEGLASRRQRLQMICAVMLAGFGLFFLRQLLFDRIETAMHWRWAVVFAALGLAAAPLTFWRTLNRRVLLAVEGLIFSGSAWFFTMSMNDAVLLNVEHAPPDLPWAVFNVMNSTTWFCVLAFSYTMVVAGSWRRVAAIVPLILLLPALVTISARSQSPVFAATVNSNMLTLILLTLLTCGGALLYWAYRFEQLTRDAARARRFGQYRLKQLIGRGGMGEVYLAEHVLLKRPCALKRIRPGQDTDPITLARFEREVRATAELSHPHTVEIYDYGRAGDGTFYYVMELLWGLTLDDLVHRFGPLPAARAVYLLRQVCDALEEAHAAGLMHRDIKPGNIYAARRGGEYDFVKLLDFGLVKGVMRTDQPALSRAETIVGSPLYMAPEQSLNEGTSDVRSDIYSLGAVGYFLMVGHPPFVAENPLEIMIAHARDAVRPPSQLAPDLPADVETILLKCLAKDPAERFASSAALGRGLAGCSIAGHWTRDDAAHWWQAHQDSLVPGLATATDTMSFIVKEDSPLGVSPSAVRS